eukprot:4177893-Pleurochrysis_carterae.AAC.1
MTLRLLKPSADNYASARPEPIRSLPSNSGKSTKYSWPASISSLDSEVDMDATRVRNVLAAISRKPLAVGLKEGSSDQ